MNAYFIYRLENSMLAKVLCWSNRNCELYPSTIER